MCSESPRPSLFALGPLAGALLLSLALGACGKKGDPLPPLRTIPAPTQDLSVAQQGRLILLEMAYPSTTSAGQALGGIDSVELFAVSKPTSAEGPLPTAEPYEFLLEQPPLLVLQGTELQSSILGDRIQFRLPLADSLPAVPTATIFAVRTTKLGESSRLSNRVALRAQEPPAAPSGLDAQARRPGVELTWRAPGEAEGFDVYRRLATERGYGNPIGRAAGEDRSYVDRSASYGERYIYTVRTVGVAEPLVHSDPAGEREIEYLDRFPPRLPQNLVALPERGSIRLRWDPSPDRDVAGYILLRRDPTRNELVRITDEPVTGTEYLDRGLASGLTFEYRIRVVDHLGNESHLGPPVAATTR